MKKLLTLLTIMVSLFIAACSDPLVPALRIGTNVWPGYEPLYLAREMGYFENNKIQLVEYTSASQVLKAYRNGLIDAAAVTLDEAIRLLASGEQPRILLVMDISNGGDAILGQPSLKSFSHLKGKRVGVEHTALGAYFVSRALELNYLNNHDITLVPLEVQHHERAFKEKQIDAVVTFDPVRSKLLSAGAKILFDSSQIPGEIVDVLIINKEKLDQFGASIQHLKSGWFQALDDINKKPLEAMSILGKRSKQSYKKTIESYMGLHLPNKKQNAILLYSRPEPELLETSKKLAEVMVKIKLISPNINTRQLFIEKSN
jgi:NitT/TauT family transport system substrate-binding protein